MRKMIVRGIAISLWVIVIVGYFVGIPSNSVFMLTKYSDDTKAALTKSGKTLQFTADGKQYSGWLFPAPGREIIMFSHGNGTNMYTLTMKIKVLNDLGYPVFTYDYDAKNTEDMFASAHAAYEYVVKDLHYKPEQIVAYGESIGVPVTAELVEKHPVKSVILESGFASMNQIIHDSFRICYYIYPHSTFPHLDTVEAIRHYKGPALVIGCQQDGIIPWQHSQEIAAACGGQLVLLPHSDHALTVAPEEDRLKFVAALKSFLNGKQVHENRSAPALER